MTYDVARRPPAVFLSYRRAQDAQAAARLASDLTERGIRVFHDLAAIQPGARWQERIDSAVRSSDAVLALIGPQWLHGWRTHEGATDWVEYELAGALRLNKTIIPVLLHAPDHFTTMPTGEQLPQALRALPNYQAHGLDLKHWDGDVEHLARVLHGMVPTPPPWLGRTDVTESRHPHPRGSTSKLPLTLGAAAVVLLLALAGFGVWLGLKFFGPGSVLTGHWATNGALHGATVSVTDVERKRGTVRFHLTIDNTRGTKDFTFAFPNGEFQAFDQKDRTYDRDVFVDTWTSSVPAGGKLNGLLQLGSTVPDDATSMTLRFTHKADPFDKAPVTRTVKVPLPPA